MQIKLFAHKVILRFKQAEGFQIQNQQNSQNGKGKKQKKKENGKATTEEGTEELWRLALLMLDSIFQKVVKYQLRRCTPS